MNVCPECHKKVKNINIGVWGKKNNQPEAEFFHSGCLRHSMSPYIAKAREEARNRVIRLLSDWRLVLGAWMSLRGYPHGESVNCPVCDGFIGGSRFIPQLKYGLWEREGVTVGAYYCRICEYFLPELPQEGIDEDMPFERQWEVIKSIYGSET